MARRRSSGGKRVVEVAVESLGGQGDGLARSGDQTLYIPFGAPGDRLRVAVGRDNRAAIEERLADGPDRVTPPCPHFGQCGGCSLQHIETSSYHGWKHDILIRALERRGLVSGMVEPLVAGAPGRRRRVRLHYVRTVNGVVLGFRAGQSRNIVDVAECPVATSAIETCLPSLREVITGITEPGARGEIAVTDTETGVDVVLHSRADPGLAEREALSAFAERQDIARLCWRPLSRGGAEAAEPVVARRAPTVSVDGIAVPLPPDGFLQPTVEGEAALRTVVMGALPESGRVLDLFSGSGAFSLPPAKGGLAVHAVERDPAQIAALEQAARSGGFGERVTGEVRDLDRRPLLPRELTGFDAVILDPPRAGAQPQIEQIAPSGVALVVYVSCNPVTFARDAEMLVTAGYRLERAVPVDQFVWTPHLELAAVFRKDEGENA